MRKNRTISGKEIRRNASHFTLIELLVVIAIIAILMSLLMPALKKTKDRAKELQCLNNLKQNGVGILQYANDFNGYLVIGNRGTYTEDPYTDTPYTGPIHYYRGNFDAPTKSTCFAIGTLWKYDYLNTTNSFFCLMRKTEYHHPALGDLYWNAGHTYRYYGGLRKIPSYSRLKITNNPRASLMFDIQYTTHRNGKVNTLYLDGAVQSIKPNRFFWDNGLYAKSVDR